MWKLGGRTARNAEPGRSGDQDTPHVPVHGRMRANDRDLIRGGHYGQRSCEPRQQAEHMAAPTKPCDVKILLANSEPSTHGTKLTYPIVRDSSAFEGEAEVIRSTYRPGPPAVPTTGGGRYRRAVVRCLPSGASALRFP